MRSKKIWIFLFVFCLLILGESLLGANGQKSRVISVLTEKDTTSDILKLRDPMANVDSLLVIHFHPTVQCSCCINVGSFAKKSLEKYYARPCKDSLIIFKEYNIDEDSSTARKYKIFWSALGFQKFSKKKNEFKEIESVWEFCENEEKFLMNFKKELDQFLFPSKKEKPPKKTQKKKHE